jgi:uncharacterized membrane protein
MTLGLKLGALAEYLRGALWFAPTVSVVIAFVVAALLTQIDPQVAEGSLVASLIYSGGADGARGMLQAVAGSVITVTSLVFSLTVVTLQLASSQFSPRLLRTFLRDPTVQVVLSIFLATFAYSLTVLRSIRGSSGAGDDFVPALAVTVAFALVLASVFALVYYISFITEEIRVDTLMRHVELSTRGIIERVYPEPVERDRPDVPVPDIPRLATALPCPKSGFLQGVAVESLFQAACEHDVVLRLDSAVGDYVVDGAPLAWAWRADDDKPPDDPEELTRRVAGAVQIGFERTLQQDVAYGLRQLVDVAAKALSPGVNDPATAVHAIGHLASLLCALARRRVQPLLRCDGRGTVRVAADRPDFDDYVDLACGQIRRYGAGEPAVTAALLDLVRQVAACVLTERQRSALEREAQLIVTAAERETVEPADLDRVHRAATAAARALHGDARL